MVTAAAGPVVLALDAEAPLVCIAVAQRQPFGQIFGIDVAVTCP